MISWIICESSTHPHSRATWQMWKKGATLAAGKACRQPGRPGNDTLITRTRYVMYVRQVCIFNLMRKLAPERLTSIYMRP